jgi:aspartate aminotransferase
VPQSSTVAQLTDGARALRSSATLAINELSADLIARGRTIYRLGLGQSPFPVPTSVVESLKANAHQKDYLPVRGLPALRRSVAEHVERYTGLLYDASLVQVGPGSKELIFLTQLILDVELVLPSPSWVSYEPQGVLAGRRIAWLDTTRATGWNLQPEVLDRWCAEAPDRARLLILNYPNNPSGRTLDAATLARLADVCRRYGVLVVSDEIYGLVDHGGRHETIARFYPEGTILSTGLSKWCGAGGWRLGAMLFPVELKWMSDALASAASETFTTVSAPIQFAAVTAFTGSPEIDDYLRHSRRILRALGLWCASTLRAGRLLVDDPEGGFYLLPDASAFAASLARRGIADSEAMVKRILADTGVALLPGSVFGRPREEYTFRLSYVDFDGAAALRASATRPDGELGETFLLAHAPRVAAAIRALVSWFNEVGQ